MLQHRQTLMSRDRLRTLDGCLNDLEDAHERDETIVSEGIASRLRQQVDGIMAGMPIRDAIDLVMHEQERYLGLPATPESRRLERSESADFGAALDESSARVLTEEIKTNTRRICLLLLEAHRRRAWAALSYKTWDEYIQVEFGFSRTRSYELLDQGRIIRALMAAAGVSAIPDISAYAARQIKEHLPEVIQSIRERCNGATEAQALQVLVEAVEAQRTSRAQLEQANQVTTGRRLVKLSELTTLCEVIDRLTSMPPVVEVVTRIPKDQAHRLARLDSALRWLYEFAEEWRRFLSFDSSDGVTRQG